MMTIVSTLYHKWNKDGYFARFQCSNCGKIVERKMPYTGKYCDCNGDPSKKLKKSKRR